MLRARGSAIKEFLVTRRLEPGYRFVTPVASSALKAPTILFKQTGRSAEVSQDFRTFTLPLCSPKVLCPGDAALRPKLAMGPALDMRSFITNDEDSKRPSSAACEVSRSSRFFGDAAAAFSQSCVCLVRRTMSDIR